MAYKNSNDDNLYNRTASERVEYSQQLNPDFKANIYKSQIQKQTLGHKDQVKENIRQLENYINNLSWSEKMEKLNTLAYYAYLESLNQDDSAYAKTQLTEEEIHQKIRKMNQALVEKQLQMLEDDFYYRKNNGLLDDINTLKHQKIWYLQAKAKTYNNLLECQHEFLDSANTVLITLMQSSDFALLPQSIQDNVISTQRLIQQNLHPIDLDELNALTASCLNPDGSINLSIQHKLDKVIEKMEKRFESLEKVTNAIFKTTQMLEKHNPQLAKELNQLKDNYQQKRNQYQKDIALLNTAVNMPMEGKNKFRQITTKCNHLLSKLVDVDDTHPQIKSLANQAQQKMIAMQATQNDSEKETLMLESICLLDKIHHHKSVDINSDPQQHQLLTQVGKLKEDFQSIANLSDEQVELQHINEQKLNSHDPQFQTNAENSGTQSIGNNKLTQCINTIQRSFSKVKEKNPSANIEKLMSTLDSFKGKEINTENIESLDVEISQIIHENCDEKVKKKLSRQWEEQKELIIEEHNLAPSSPRI